MGYVVLKDILTMAHLDARGPAADKYVFKTQYPLEEVGGQTGGDQGKDCATHVVYDQNDVQQQKEALEDLSGELELADEDDPVLYVSP